MALPLARPQEAPHSAPAPIAVARPRLPTAEAILPYLQRIDEARWYSNFGPLLVELEQRLAERFRPETQIVTVANATQALTLTLQAMDLPPGGHVVLPAWTFVATAHAVVQAGLKPWFLDVDPATWMLDPATVATLSSDLKREVAAVIPVCAFGIMPDLDAWLAFREATGVPVLVDAAAAFDTLHDARLPAVVSLHATKVLGLGEGGFLATEDAALALKVRQLTTYGFNASRDSRVVATNAKLSEYAAAVGLAALDGWPGDRLRWLRTAQMLRIALIGLPEVRFQPGWGSDWVTSVCTVGLPDDSAQALARTLADDGVDSRPWWGGGCHTSAAFVSCRREDLSVTERLAASTLGLPFSIDMDAQEISRVAAAVSRTLSGR
ncbi:MAG: DegT/DnrJ/EryC1/StrS family aminotransferase [Caulobacterales bacterium]